MGLAPVKLPQYEIVKNFNPLCFEDSNNRFTPAFCDWLSFSIELPSSDLSRLFEFLRRYNLDFVLIENSNYYIYQLKYMDNTFKCMIGASPKVVWLNGPERTFLSLTGEYCRYLQREKIFYQFCSEISAAFSLRCNRIDISKDSFDSNLFGWLKDSTPAERASRIHTTLKYSQPTRPELSKDGKLYNGWCFYFTSNKLRDKSNCILRIYDKKAEKQLDCDCWHRMEFMFKYVDSKNEQSNTYFKALVNGTSLEELFKTACYLRFVLVKKNCKTKIRVKGTQIDSHVSPLFKDFALGYLPESEFSVRKSSVLRIVSDYLNNVESVDYSLKVDRAMSNLGIRLPLALSGMTNQQIFSYLEKQLDIYRERFESMHKLVFSYKAENFEDSIPVYVVDMFDNKIDLWEHLDLLEQLPTSSDIPSSPDVEKLPALSDAEPQLQFMEEIHKSDYRLL